MCMCIYNGWFFVLICRFHSFVRCKKGISERASRPECKISRTHFASVWPAVDLCECWRVDGIYLCRSCFSHWICPVLWNSFGHFRSLRSIFFTSCMLFVCWHICYIWYFISYFNCDFRVMTSITPMMWRTVYSSWVVISRMVIIGH